MQSDEKRRESRRQLSFREGRNSLLLSRGGGGIFNHSVIWTVMKETGGVRTLYNGLFPGVVANCASWGMYFFFYERLKRIEGDLLLTPRDSASRHLLSGLLAGGATVLATNPLWLIKTRMQLASSSSRSSPPVSSDEGYESFRKSIRTIYHRENGIIGFYKGIVPALFLTIHGAVQFASYEKLKSIHASSSVSSSPREAQINAANTHEYFFMAGVSKVIATLLTYPAQVVKTRMQQDNHGGAGAGREGSYARTLDAIVRILRNEGPLAFYKGMAVNLVRVAPSSALTLTAYEIVSRVLRRGSSAAATEGARV